MVENINRQSITKKPKSRKCMVKVVVIGDTNVGKTSIIQRLNSNKFSGTYKPTIGADFSNKVLDLEDRVITL